MGRGPAGAAAIGMLSGLYAEAKPEAVAIVDDAQTRTFAALHTRANRLARALKSLGLRPGDALALMCANRVEYVESFLAAMRIGLRITPVNWHLAQEEARYIVENCEAKALVCEAVFTDLFPETQGLYRVAIGGAPGWIDYETTLLAESPDDPPNLRLGTIMLYTSGTTGRPKGVFRAHPEVIEPQGRGSFADYDPDTDVNLCPGPAYHAAPLLFDVRWPLASGVPIVLLRQWNSEAVLRAIDERRITHCHMAPIMFHRLLALPEAVRALCGDQPAAGLPWRCALPGRGQARDDRLVRPRSLGVLRGFRGRRGYIHHFARLAQKAWKRRPPAKSRGSEDAAGGRVTS